MPEAQERFRRLKYCFGFFFWPNFLLARWAHGCNAIFFCPTSGSWFLL